MPSVEEELARVRWLIQQGKVTLDDRCKLVLPKIDAKERIRNERKIKRITIQTDEDGVSEYAAIKEAWMGELDNNPSLYFAALLQALKTFDVRGWKESQEADGV